MIFDEQTSRKPDHYPWSSAFIDVMWHSFWTPNHFDFKSDIQDFKTNLTEQEQEIVKRTLSAIGQIEISVKTFWAKLGDNLPHPSLKDLGFVMANVEVIHNRAYEKLLDVLNLGDTFEENLKLDIIQGRVNYLRKYNQKMYENDKKQYIYSLILFTLFVENVSLFSQFYVILWMNRFKNVLKDSAQQIQYTKNEELIHAQVGIKLINTIRDEYPELFDQDLEDLIKVQCLSAYQSECKIIEWILGDYKDESISVEILQEYIKNRFNDSFVQIGYSKLFSVDQELLNETRWMEEELYGNSMTDFFHKRPVEYAKSNKVYDEDDLF